MNEIGTLLCNVFIIYGGKTMETYICALIISFFIYAFAGWIWESLLLPIATHHKVKNSGFLNGPIVPIYGVGAIVVSLLFYPQEAYLSVFIEGAFVACIIEYLTSWIMEKLYHQRWWDYSDKAFNVNGRVCLEGFLVFGLFSVVAVKFIQPALMEWIMQYSMTFLIIIATILSTILVIDLCVTVRTLAHLDERIEEFMKDVELYAQEAFDEFERSKGNMLEIIDMMKKKDTSSYQKIYKQKKLMDRRIVKAFPHLVNKSTHKKGE